MKSTNKGSPTERTEAGWLCSCFTWITQSFIPLTQPSPQIGQSWIQAVSEKGSNVGPGGSLQQREIRGGWEKS